MARQPGRYIEGRFYMAWAALALLLASWAGIAVQDQVERSRAQNAEAIPITTSNGPAGVTIQPQVHTRTRGS